MFPQKLCCWNWEVFFILEGSEFDKISQFSIFKQLNTVITVSQNFEKKLRTKLKVYHVRPTFSNFFRDESYDDLKANPKKLVNFMNFR